MPLIMAHFHSFPRYKIVLRYFSLFARNSTYTKIQRNFLFFRVLHILWIASSNRNLQTVWCVYNKHYHNFTVREIGSFKASTILLYYFAILRKEAYEGYRLVAASVYILSARYTSRDNRLQNVWIKSTKKLNDCAAQIRARRHIESLKKCQQFI